MNSIQLMKKSVILPAGVLLAVGLSLALFLFQTRAANTDVKQHRDKQQTVLEHLPQGAMLHFRCKNAFDVLEDIENLIVSVVPEKGLPQDAQGLLQTGQPIRTILGMQLAQQPLTPGIVSERLGIVPTAPATLTFYPGDPRKLFAFSVTVSDKQTFSKTICNILKPESYDKILLGDEKVLRLSFNADTKYPGIKREIPREIVVVFRSDQAFICGDRSVAMGILNSPTRQRLNHNPFVTKVVKDLGQRDAMMIFDPTILKPFLMQPQVFRPLGVSFIHQQRAQIFSQIPEPIKHQWNIQLKYKFGIQDVNQLGEYLEAVVVALYDQVIDQIASEAMAMEGIGMAMDFNSDYPGLFFKVYSHSINPKDFTSPVPIKDIQTAMLTLGGDFNTYIVKGRKPKTQESEFGRNLCTRIQNEIKRRGLKSAFLDSLEELVDEKTIPQPIETKVPWTITTCIDMDPAKSPLEFDSVEAYFKHLGQVTGWPLKWPVNVIPGENVQLLADTLKKQVRAENRNRNLDEQMAQNMFDQRPLFLKESRLKTRYLDSSIDMFTIERSYRTRGGLFGYSEHELVNRKLIYATTYKGYTVYHQGNRGKTVFNQNEEPDEIPPAVLKLVEHVPDGANHFSILRLAHRVPEWIDWAAALEKTAQSEVNAFLKKAEEIKENTSSPAELTAKLEELMLPPFIYSLNLDEETDEFYCLLPGGKVCPRPRIAPLLQELVAGFKPRADEIGGTLFFTRAQPESYECGLIMNTEAIAYLVKTGGNTFLTKYLGSPEKIGKLHKLLTCPKDNDPQRMSEVLVVNPRWAAFPGPNAFIHHTLN